MTDPTSLLPIPAIDPETGLPHRMGGLFSGVGGFELAWTRLGGEVAWMCEIDPHARKVLRQQFPGVPIYDDVTQLDPDEVAAVDLLTGGSPCQSFSSAGMRKGMHGESGLVVEMLRVIDGLSRRGLKHVLWENVQGALTVRNPDGSKVFPQIIASFLYGLDAESVARAKAAPDPDALRVRDASGGFVVADLSRINPASPPSMWVVDPDASADDDGVEVNAAGRRRRVDVPSLPDPVAAVADAFLDRAAGVVAELGMPADVARATVYAETRAVAVGAVEDDDVDDDEAADVVADALTDEAVDAALRAARFDDPASARAEVLRPIAFDDASPRIVLDADPAEVDRVVRSFPAKARLNAGMATSDQRAVSWRLLDSRYVGSQVPQRRRRVFAYIALGDDHREERALATLLALPQDDGTVAVGDRDESGRWSPPWTEQADLFGVPATGDGDDRARVWLVTDDVNHPGADRFADVSEGRCEPGTFLDVDADGRLVGRWCDGGVAEHSHVRLSEILERDVDGKYVLSAKARMGIIKRANRRNKTLPGELHAALEDGLAAALGAFPGDVPALSDRQLGDAGLLSRPSPARLVAVVRDQLAATAARSARDSDAVEAPKPADDALSLFATDDLAAPAPAAAGAVGPLADVDAFVDAHVDRPLYDMVVALAAANVPVPAALDAVVGARLAAVAHARVAVGDAVAPAHADTLGSSPRGGGSPIDLDRMTFLPVTPVGDVAAYRALGHGHYVEDDHAATLHARDGKAGTVDVVTVAGPGHTHALTANGCDASEDGTGRGTPIMTSPVAFRKAGRARSVDDAETWVSADEANTLNSFDEGSDIRTTHAVIQPDGPRGYRQVKHGVLTGDETSSPVLARDGHGARDVVVSSFALRGRDDGAQVEMGDGRSVNTLRGEGGSSRDFVVAHAFDARQSDVLQYGDSVGPLDTDGHSVGVLVPDAVLVGAPTGLAVADHAVPLTGADAPVGGAVLVRNREGKPGGGKGPLLSEEQSLTLACANDQILFAPGGGFNVHAAESSAMRSPGPGRAAFPSDHSRSIDTTGGFATNQGGTVVVAPIRDQGRRVRSVRAAGFASDRPAVYGDAPAPDATPTPPPTLQVRRLTPIECERLQAFPPTLAFRLDRLGDREAALAACLSGMVELDPASGGVVQVAAASGRPFAEPVPVDGALAVEVGPVSFDVPVAALAWALSGGRSGDAPAAFDASGAVADLDGDVVVWTLPYGWRDRARAAAVPFARRFGADLASDACVAALSGAVAADAGLDWMFVDEWTNVAEYVDGRPVRMSDTSRYKQLGNAVTVEAVWWCLRRAAVAFHDAALAGATLAAPRHA